MIYEKLHFTAIKYLSVLGAYQWINTVFCFNNLYLNGCFTERPYTL